MTWLNTSRRRVDASKLQTPTILSIYTQISRVNWSFVSIQSVFETTKGWKKVQWLLSLTMTSLGGKLIRQNGLGLTNKAPGHTNLLIIAHIIVSRLSFSRSIWKVMQLPIMENLELEALFR
jgi:hypothetical protein